MQWFNAMALRQTLELAKLLQNGIVVVVVITSILNTILGTDTSCLANFGRPCSKERPDWP